MKLRILFFALLSSLPMFGQMRLLDSVEVNKINLEEYLIVNYSQTEEIEVVPGQKVFIDFTLSDVPRVYDSVIYEWGGVRLGSKELVPFEIVADDNENSVSVYVTKGKKEVNLRSGAKGFDLKQKVTPNEPWFSSDKLVFGILTVLLALVFYTSSLQNKFWKKFYMIVPSLLLCYLLPALFNSLGIISKDYSSLYNVAKDYLLPAALILMTIGIDFKAVVNLGPKAIIMFLTATVGIILGGPVAILVFSWIDPSVVGGDGYDAAWRGFSTLAGSWIGVRLKRSSFSKLNW